MLLKRVEIELIDVTPHDYHYNVEVTLGIALTPHNKWRWKCCLSLWRGLACSDASCWDITARSMKNTAI